MDPHAVLGEVGGECMHYALKVKVKTATNLVLTNTNYSD